MCQFDQGNVCYATEKDTEGQHIFNAKIIFIFIGKYTLRRKQVEKKAAHAG